MKTIISKLNTDTTIDINEITNDSYVGFDFKHEGKHIVINSIDFENKDCFMPSNLENESTVEYWGCRTKKECVEMCHSVGCEAFVFETKEEMLNWLIN